MRRLLVGGSALALIAVFIFASYYYKDKQTEKYSFMAQDNAATFIRDHSQTLGSDDAKIFLVEFMDPACETCAAFAPFVKKMMDANPGKIKLVLRYAPFHDGADYFVKVLEAARNQDKYWETLDVMYRSQPAWASHHDPQPQRIWQYLPLAGLDIERLKQDMSDPAIVNIINQDLADAKTLDVRKTPGFFVNGKPLQVFGYNELYELVQAELRIIYSD
jgi:protein-disulfide isomerase